MRLFRHVLAAAVLLAAAGVAAAFTVIVFFGTDGSTQIVLVHQWKFADGGKGKVTLPCDQGTFNFNFSQYSLGCTVHSFDQSNVTRPFLYSGSDGKARSTTYKASHNGPKLDSVEQSAFYGWAGNQIELLLPLAPFEPSDGFDPFLPQNVTCTFAKDKLSGRVYDQFQVADFTYTCNYRCDLADAPQKGPKPDVKGKFQLKVKRARRS